MCYAYKEVVDFKIVIWFDSRLLVKLNVETPEPIYISKNKAPEFKAWIVQD